MSQARILITRPEPMASRWRQWLESRGFNAQVASCMAIEPLADEHSVQAIKHCVLAFDEYQKAIFISRNAAQEALNWLEDYWPQWPIGVTCYAVGKATAEALEAAGVVVSSLGHDGGAMNSETLLAEPGLQAVDGQRIVIFRGRGGRELLASTLRERGARVDQCELYRRTIPEGAGAAVQDWLAGAGERDLITAHSGESVENLCHVADVSGSGAALRRQALLVPGQRVAEIAQRSGFNTIAVALNAGDSAMLAQIERYQKALG